MNTRRLENFVTLVVLEFQNNYEMTSYYMPVKNFLLRKEVIKIILFWEDNKKTTQVHYKMEIRSR